MPIRPEAEDAVAVGEADTIARLEGEDIIGETTTTTITETGVVVGTGGEMEIGGQVEVPRITIGRETRIGRGREREVEMEIGGHMKGRETESIGVHLGTERGIEMTGEPVVVPTMTEKEMEIGGPVEVPRIMIGRETESLRGALELTVGGGSHLPTTTASPPLQQSRPIKPRP